MIVLIYLPLQRIFYDQMYFHITSRSKIKFVNINNRHTINKDNLSIFYDNFILPCHNITSRGYSPQ